MEDDALTREIIGCAYKVHNALGAGFLEKVYENALRIELIKLGHKVKQQEPINVTYEGHIVGEYFADLWVDEIVVLEIKAVQMLAKIHEVQLVNYLTATGINTGLVLNFGSSVQVRRKFREYTPKAFAEFNPVSLGSCAQRIVRHDEQDLQDLELKEHFKRRPRRTL